MNTRPMYWLIRRELWENRSIVIAPLIVTAVVLFGTLLSMIGLPRRVRTLPALTPAKQHALIVKPFSLAPAPIMLATFLVGFFYSLDALYGERRDRSIQFWKSLPVSDLDTVLSKASIPLLVLPAIAWVLSIITLAIVLFFSTATLLSHGLSPTIVWAELHFIELPLTMIYGLAVHALWFAPIYAWLLLVSAWAKRATFVWAVLPFFAIGALERIAFNSTFFLSMLKYRFVGAMTEAFALEARGGKKIIDETTQLDPWGFLSSAGLWTGLLFAGVCIAATVRLRRRGGAL